MLTYFCPLHAILKNMYLILLYVNNPKLNLLTDASIRQRARNLQDKYLVMRWTSLLTCHSINSIFTCKIFMSTGELLRSR